MIDGAYAMIHAAMPPTPVAVLRRAYRDGVHFQSSRGSRRASTCVCEHRLQALKALDDAGELTVRIEAAISWQDDIFPVRRRWELLSGERHYYRSARLSANAVKFHFDGTVEPRSSYLLTPWPNEADWRGKLNLTPEHITDMLVDMDRRGIRVIAHCTGDGASDVFLDAVAEARRRNGFSGVRHQCAHSTLLHPGNLKRFQELQVIAEFSPAAWYPTPFASGARSGYGQERLKRIYDFKGVLEAGGTAVFGTDWPVASIDLAGAGDHGHPAEPLERRPGLLRRADHPGAGAARGHAQWRHRHGPGGRYRQPGGGQGGGPDRARPRPVRPAGA